ncbi:MAG TPA: glycosyltransferase [Pyrinomonadaceae bacterium]
MNVLHVIPSLAEKSGGPSQAIIPMCLALQEKGIDVSLVSTDEGFSGPLAANFFDYKGVKTRLFPVNWGSSFKYSKELRAWLESNVSTFDIVHIHAVFNHACVAAARACQMKRVPYVLRPLGSLDSWSMKQKKLKKQLFWQLAAKKMVQNAAVVHYTSVAEQHDSESYLELNRGAVVPLGVDVPVQVDPMPDENNPYVLVISRLVPTKNIHVLLESFIELSRKEEFAKWRLIIGGAGDEGYVRELEARVVSGQVETKVLFKGWVSGADKFSLLRSASLFALPSQHENFGVSVVEAMACKVPVVVSPEVAVSAQIQAWDAGWISSAETLTNVLAAAMSNHAERQRRGEAAFELAKEFSWSNVAEKISTLYEQITVPRVLQPA